MNSKKHKEAYNNYAERKYILEAIRYVDKVIPEKDWDQKISDVKKSTISILSLWEVTGKANLTS